LLDHDIRKLPALVKPWNRRNSNSSIPQTGSTGRTSTSAPSTADGPTGSGFSGRFIESPVTSAPEGLQNRPISGFKKKRKVRLPKEHPLRVQTNFDSSPQPSRYWNEFDDGDEGSPDEAYTIFVDPHAGNKFPGSALISKTMAMIRAASRQATSWVRPVPPPSTAEHQALITPEYFFTQSSPDDDDDEPDEESQVHSLMHPNHRLSAPRHYSSIPAPSTFITPALRRRSHHLLRASTATLIISGILLLVAAALTALGSRSTAGTSTTVRAGLAVTIVASVIFGLVGLGIILTTSHEQRSWISLAAVGLFFTMECVCGGALLVMGMRAG
jgi:hypothetical protein